MSKYKFTSESVTEGHPDKICDISADALLDAMLMQDPFSRSAIEMLVKNRIYIAGEVTTKAKVNYDQVIRKTLNDIGYCSSEIGIDCNKCDIVFDLSEQSTEIAEKVNETSDKEQGAGDQGMMFGYAIASHGPEYMPLPIMLANNITKQMAYVRKNRIVPWLRPDGKAQVTVEYEHDSPLRISTLVVAAHHSDDIDNDIMKKEITSKIIKPACGKWLDDETELFINPIGKFTLGGPAADSGLTGRKLIVDTYGGWAGHGGGSFSGKDPSKVDRSATYMMRHIAKNIVAAGLASECSAEVAYVIGLAKPVSFRIDTRGTGICSDEKLGVLATQVFDLKPRAIIQHLNLRRPIYRKTACYGHFGRAEPEFAWEAVDDVPILVEKASKLGIEIENMMTPKSTM